MPIGSGGLQNFLRMTGLFGPQDDSAAYEGMPSELPMARGTPPIAAPNRGAPGISMPGAYGPEPQQGFNPQAMGEPDELDTLAAFKQNVMNPPQRKHMTYPKNTLAGLDAALKIAAEPSPLEKNRVWVNGKAHQKQQVRIDPVTGEKQFITNVHEPSFGSQVMRAMPAAISPAVDILNQPHEDAMGDWDIKNRGLAAAANAESAMALAGQRRANAGAIPEKTRQGDRALDIKEMDAETRARVASLKDLPDSERLRLLQEGKVTLQELNAASAMAKQERGGEIRSGQIDQQGRIRSGQIAQQGDIRSGQIAQQGDIRSGQIAQQGDIRAGQIAQQAGEARATKAAPSGAGSAAGQVPTQQRVAAQAKATQLLDEHPEWKDKIVMDPDTQMPTIKLPNDPWMGEPDYTEYDKIYEALYGRKRGATGGAAAPITAPPAARPAKPAASVGATPPPVVAPVKAGGSGGKGSVRVTTPDGRTGTWDLSKGPVPNGFKKVQ